MNQLTTVAAVELAPHKIRVVAIGPGTILTELARNSVLADDAGRRKILRARRSAGPASPRRSPRSPRSWQARTRRTSRDRRFIPTVAGWR